MAVRADEINWFDFGKVEIINTAKGNKIMIFYNKEEEKLLQLEHAHGFSMMDMVKILKELIKYQNTYHYEIEDGGRLIDRFIIKVD